MANQADLNTISAAIDAAYKSIAVNLKNGLLAYWGLDDYTWQDITGNNPLTSVGETTNDVGIVDRCAVFKGNYLSLPTGRGLNFGTNDFSISLWVNLDTQTAPYPAIVSCVNYNSFFKVSLVAGYTNRIGFEHLDHASIASSFQLNTNTWYHVVVQRQNGIMYLYINGLLNQTITDTYPIDLGNGGTVIGGGNWNGSQGIFIGKLDEIGIWSRALTESEIAFLYNSGSGIPSSSILTNYVLSNKTLSAVYLTTPPTPDANTITATSALTSYIQRCGNNVTDTKNLYSFIKGCIDLGIWNNMVCWPMRLGQNAVTGNTIYSLGGLLNNTGTIYNAAYKSQYGTRTDGSTSYATLNTDTFWQSVSTGDFTINAVTITPTLSVNTTATMVGKGVSESGSEGIRFGIDPNNQYHISIHGPNAYIIDTYKTINDTSGHFSSLGRRATSSGTLTGIGVSYIDGTYTEQTPGGSGNLSVNLNSWSNKTYIGYYYYASNAYFNGAVPFVSLHNTNLTQPQLTAFNLLYKDTLGKGLNLP
jgi:hypothetical protein